MNAMATVTTALLIFAWNPIAPANTPVPERPPEKPESTRATAPVVLKTEVLKGEEKAVRAKIVIPKKFVHGDAGRAIIPPAGAAPLRGEIVPDSGEGLAGMPMVTVIAGLALSMAAVSAVFVFRGNRSTKTAALAVLAGAGVLGAFGVANADLIVPGRERPREPVLIVIELTEEGDSVTLTLAK